MNKRFAYMDFIRFAAVFLVIVNHTNSDVFQSSSPASAVWWISIVWYYLSKMGVPLFVMVSGACLLPKVDTYKKAFQRFLRIGAVLVLFSYLYFISDVIQGYGGVQDALNVLGFLKSVWHAPITDSFWYLYFYLGLMLMLPWLQRLAKAMQKRDLLYLILLSFALSAVWPLAAHYVPALAFSGYFSIPLFAVYLGIFFAGHYIHAYVTKINKTLCAAVIALSLAASALLTNGEYQSLNGIGKYWFMDERTAPSFFVILSALAVMMLSKSAIRESRKQTKSRLQTLGGCAFGIYLVQDFIIEQTRYSLFLPLAQQIGPMVAVLLWELGIFFIALLCILLLRKVPGVQKLI
ncbi:MAG: acyltransferase family protein [Bacillota bacterium]